MIKSAYSIMAWYSRLTKKKFTKYFFLAHTNNSSEWYDFIVFLDFHSHINKMTVRANRSCPQSSISCISFSSESVYWNITASMNSSNRMK
jgi:hypothetical protein